MTKRLLLFISLCFLLLVSSTQSLWAKDFVIPRGKTINIYMPPTQHEVAKTAIEMLDEDIHRVLASQLRPSIRRKADIICSIDTKLPREGFAIKVKNGKLHITGADDHGVAYGMLEISRLIGVSPWEYWADCRPSSKEELRLADGYEDQQSPKVAYRGIFINDEDWGLNPWATKQEPEAWTIKSGRLKGAVGPKVNEKIFQLLLRLRANYYWPAMHECSQPFFTIKGNREMARKYGIYIGGSHCEPMATSPAAEWALRGEGEYNYVSNRENVLKFWKERLDEVKNQEILFTLGMRGVHDGAMQGVKTLEEKTRYLQMVIDDQRKMLGEGVPQVFIPYKEVLDIYKNGLRLPDDVTLMWTDDNYGYIRHFPDSVEKARKGGNGLYYHCSYWGRPHDYLWLNSMPLGIMNQQLRCAYENGIRQIWVLNVGDIKPSELQTEFFMDMAWNGQNTQQPTSDGFLQSFCKREFGEDFAQETADILDKYLSQTSVCKPEFMAGTRVEEADKAYWNKVKPLPGDWDKEKISWRLRSYDDISRRTDSLYRMIPTDRQDAFFQLVKYPVQAAAQMSFKYLCPERCVAAHDSIQALTYQYNKVCSGGKWDGIMDASPRNLAVFQKVSPEMLPQYPEKSVWQQIDAAEDVVKSADVTEYIFDTADATDSVTIQVRLLPTHPVEGDSLSFCIWVDDACVSASYETHGRSEEWKQNVLRGYAVRTFTVPIDRTKTRHSLLFKPLTKGVYGQRVFLRNED